MTSTSDIQSEMEKASALLTAATDLMNAGRLVDIASLKNMVDSICQSVKSAGYEPCAPLKPLMIRLNEQMDSFRRAMDDRYGALTRI